MTCATCGPNRIDFAEAGSNVAITTTGNIFTATLTEIARITVPDLPDPVLLLATGIVQNTAGAASTNADVYLGIAPAGSVSPIPAANMIEAQGEINIGGSTAEIPGRKFKLVRWIEPGSPGDYVLGGWRETGSDAASVIVNAFSRAWISGHRG